MSRKRNKQYEEVLDKGKELIAFYRANPCIAAYDLLGVDFAPIQRLVFEDMWFKNYVITVAGRGFGKSQWFQSLTHFNKKGLVYLYEELPAIPSYLRNGEEEIINWDDEIYTSEGFRNTKKLCLEKGIEGKFVKTQNGFENKGSSHHPLLTINSDCEFTYKSLEDLVPGDRLCIQRNQQTFGNNVVPEDDAYLIGLFIGDGYIKNKYNVSITSEDTYIKDFCINYCTSNNVEYRKDNDKRTKNTSNIFFKKFDYFFEKYQIERTTSYYKSVPYSIRTATKEVQTAFLQGYFDTDGTVHNKNGGVSCCSVSKKLLQEVQLMLLNFGIISRLREKKTKSEFGKAYLLDIFSEDAYKFKEMIGFRLKRKQKVLDNYFQNKTLNVNKDTIPHALQLCHSITKYYHNTYTTSKKPSFRIRVGNKKEISYERLHKFLTQCREIEASGFYLPGVKDEINKLYTILKYNYYFDTVANVEDWVGDCYDFEMDMCDNTEPNYFSNGFINHNTFTLGVLAALSCMLYPGYRVGLIAPVFRQSKMIFAEIEKLYAKSTLLKEACEKRPTRGSDTCYLKFKSVSGMTPSYIEALPLGDGNKIRGSRFYLIVVDELAQVPDQTLDMVVRPMGATSLAPMERVRRLEQQTRLIELDLATAEDFEEERVNKMVMTSSGYYKFNHMWRRMKDHWSQMEVAEQRGEYCPYSVWQIPFWDLPEGFLDKNNIEEARRVMSHSEFRMEYEAAMISDSEGFFQASMIEACTLGSGHSIQMRGTKGSQYVLGVDPNQGGKASTGVVIIQIGMVNRIVAVLELKNRTIPELTKAVQDLCKQFNVIRIFMDKGGGGKAISDLLEEGYNGEEPIIDITNKEHIHLPGRHILEPVNFNPAWISEANFTTKSMLEDRKLLFPETPVGATSDLEARYYESINTMKSQMLNIVVTRTATGILHFDTPTKGQNKDLYSALILAAHGARMIERELEEEQEPLLFNSGGLIRMHNQPSNDFRDIAAGAPTSFGINPLAAAVLKKKV
jgi:intein/homing endonuclease